MGRRSRYDVVVVGSGPNGLAAAITLASAGLSTLVIEAKDTAGGGTRTAELTEPGFLHDVCSTVHPLGIASPFLRTLKLEEHGVTWCEPPLAVAHVLLDGSAVPFARSHVAGWPVARGGSQTIAQALVRIFEARGGELSLGRAVESFDELPEARASCSTSRRANCWALRGASYPAATASN